MRCEGSEGERPPPYALHGAATKGCDFRRRHISAAKELLPPWWKN